MPTYEWKIKFVADNDQDADEQVQEAILSFATVTNDEMEQVED